MISFQGQYRWLSNYFIEPDGTHVEGEFQAEKHRAMNPWRAKTIMRCTPARARKLGKRWKLTHYQQMEWNNRRIQVMRDLVRRKLMENPDMQVALTMTGDEQLVERNNWHDNFWGDCACIRCYHVGENHLGEIWMELRDEVK